MRKLYKSLWPSKLTSRLSAWLRPSPTYGHHACKAGLETEDSSLRIIRNSHSKSPTGNPTTLTKSLTGVGKAQPKRTLQSGKASHLQRCGATAGSDSSACPSEPQPGPRPGRPRRARAQARGGRRESPRPAQLRWLNSSAPPPRRPGGIAGSRSPKLRRQGRAGCRSSRDKKAARTSRS